MRIARLLLAIGVLFTANQAVDAAAIRVEAHRDNLMYAPYYTSLAQEQFVGSHTVDGAGPRGIVLPFQLPAPAVAGPAPVAHASFSIQVTGLLGVAPDYGIDLYGTPASSSSVAGTSLFYAGPDDASATLIERGIDLGSASYPAERTTSAAGDAALTAYLNGLYADPSNVGRYFFLRLNPDRADVNNVSGYWVVLTDPFYAPSDPDYFDMGAVPAITIAYVPEPLASGMFIMSAVIVLFGRRRCRVSTDC